MSRKKNCSKCLVSKPLDAFHKNIKRRRIGRPTYYDGICKQCKSTSWKSKYVYKNYKKYGLTEVEYKQFNRKCYICGALDRLCVDHDHTNNNIRGLLCASCNLGLGNFKDSINLLLKASDYLKQDPMFTKCRKLCTVSEDI